MIKVEDHQITFDSGYQVGLSDGVIGLANEGGEVYTGYDIALLHNVSKDKWTNIEGSEITKNDRIELAEYMIELWTKFKRLSLND